MARKKVVLNKKFVVKVQISIMTSEEMPQILIYNDDRTVEYMGDASQDMIEIMGGEVKKFYYAHLDERHQINIDGPAPYQEW